MTATNPNHETTFNEGIAEARIKLGAEVRPVDETIFGLRAILRAGGRDQSIPDVFNRWHMPWVFSSDHPALDELIRNIVFAADKYILEEYEKRFGNERHDRSYIIYHAWDQIRLWDFKRRVHELIVSDIKRHKADLRKNSKEFRRLAQMVYAEAQLVILKQIAEALKAQIVSLKAHQIETTHGTSQGTIAGDAGKLRRVAEHLENVAADVAILQPGAEVCEKLLTLAGKFRTKADQMLGPVGSAIDDMERILGLVEEIMPKLATENGTLREWAKGQAKIDNKEVKGELKRQIEEETAFALQKAVTLQLEVDKMLRTEDLLREEEEMKCEL